jgi:hypothetical protein
LKVRGLKSFNILESFLNTKEVDARNPNRAVEVWVNLNGNLGEPEKPGRMALAEEPVCAVDKR